MKEVENMEPTRENALVDLLDLILAKGVILHADIIITVADIPLIGISLRAAIAGMKTMLDYGLMEQWDSEIRDRIIEEERRAKAIQDQGAKICQAPRILNDT
jgi:hypothetical protein